MKRFTALVVLITLLCGLFACSPAENADADDVEVLGATIVYGKQYYAYRVGQYSTTSTYSKNVTVYEEGVALHTLLQDASRTALDDELGTVWGYRIQFYDQDAEKIEPAMFISVDGLLHIDDTLYRLDDPDEVLDLLADAVKPTNLDAVTQS
jgi:hypothetical protein